MIRTKLPGIVYVLVALGSCGRHGASQGAPPPPPSERGAVPVLAEVAAPQGMAGGPRVADRKSAAERPPPASHPRLLLTKERLGRLHRNALAGTPAWRRIERQCEEAARAHQPSGYEAWDWSEIVADCSMVWQATRKESAAATALTYFKALLDDHETVGDGKGGDRVIEHDHGYPIRTHAFYAALAYDWLYDSPKMTKELRDETVKRLDTWLNWYDKEGYLREKPIANYFTGYFGALTAAALATAGENPVPLVDRMEKLFDDLVAPTYAKKLSGGDWPEGWQYGDGAVIAMALFVDGERTVYGRDRLGAMPWLPEVAAHHAHAMYPDGGGVYDNGDWSARPAHLSPRGLFAIAAVLPDGDPVAKKARFLARSLPRPKGGEGAWVEPLGDEPGAPVENPRTGPASLEMKGTGLVFARSDWNPQASFVAFQCGPRLSDDHQHADAGHFTIVRGADPLFVDVSDYGSYSTINHNSLLIDDGGKALDYPPNQGTWGTAVSLGRFVDRGAYVFAEGDFADAYRPSKAEWGTKNPVDQADRAVLFVRPSTFVIFDRVTVARPDIRVTWEAHSLSKPLAIGSSFVVLSGKSRADLDTLLPSGAKRTLVQEPTQRGDGPFVSNSTYAPSFRIEVASEEGSRDRRFLHVVRTGAAAEPPTGPPTLEETTDAVGAWLGGSPRDAIFVLLGRRVGGLGAGTQYGAPRAATKHLITDLRPGVQYAVSMTPASELCRVSIQPGSGPAADEAGTLLLEVDSCGKP